MSTENANVMASRTILVCASLLLLHSSGVFGAPAGETIVEVMKKDLASCKMSTFLFDTAVVKGCTGVQYPRDSLELRDANIDTFLCMGVYDSFYKLCRNTGYSQESLSSTAAFDEYIKRLSPGKEAAERKQFCDSMNNVTPAYEKVKPFVSQLTKILGNGLDSKCQRLCFDWDDKFRAPCALMAWTKDANPAPKAATVPKVNVDQPKDKARINEPVGAKSAADAGKPAHPVSQEAQQETSPKKPVESNEKAPKTGTTTENKETPANPAKDTSAENPEHPKNPMNSNNGANEAMTTNNGNAANQPPKSKVEPEDEPKDVKTDPDLTEQSGLGKNPVDSVAPMPDIKETAVDDQAAHASKENQNDLPETPDNSGAMKTGVDSKVLNEEAKTSTISDDTQDHDLPPGQDYNRVEDQDSDVDQPDANDLNQNMPEPSEQREVIPQYPSIRPEEESHFFTYFMVISLLCIAGYIGYHNKQKVLAIVLEGRRSRNNRGRRRPSTASYRKLDCTLEEAVTSQCNANVTHVIY